ncbi:MAG: ECF transporter S component [Symbiobacteriia bacterium]
MPQQSAAKTVALTGMAAAIVFVLTFAVRIPAPAYRIYFNLGEAAIYTVAMLWGPRTGALAGGIGSALADVIGGYAAWSPITLMIKGFEGYVAGRLAFGKGAGRSLLGLLPAAAIMVTGYALGAWGLYGPAAVAMEVPGDLVQVTAGIIVALIITSLVRTAAGRAVGSHNLSGANSGGRNLGGPGPGAQA